MMATKIEQRAIELSIRNPHDGRDLAIVAEQGEGFITIRIVDGFQDLVTYAPNVMIMNDTVSTLTITYKKEVEVPA